MSKFPLIIAFAFLSFGFLNIPAQAYSIYNYDSTYRPINLGEAIAHKPCSANLKSFDSEYSILYEDYLYWYSGEAMKDIGAQGGTKTHYQNTYNAKMQELHNKFFTLRTDYTRYFSNCLAMVDKEKLQAEEEAKKEAEAELQAQKDAEVLRQKQLEEEKQKLEAEEAIKRQKEIDDAVAKALAEQVQKNPTQTPPTPAPTPIPTSARTPEPTTADSEPTEIETISEQVETQEENTPEPEPEPIKKPTIFQRIKNFFSRWF